MSSWLERYQRKRKRQRENRLFILGVGAVVITMAWIAIVPSLGISWDFLSVPKVAIAPVGISTGTSQTPAALPRAKNPQFEQIKDLYWRMLAESLDMEEVAIAGARVERLQKVLAQKHAKPTFQVAVGPRAGKPEALRVPASPPVSPLPIEAAIPQSPVTQQEIDAALKPAPQELMVSAPTPAGSPALDLSNLPGVNWFESSLPLLVRQLEDQLAGQMAIERKSSTTLKYTDHEFQLNVIKGLQQRFPKQLQDFSTRFKNNAIEGSGKLAFSETVFPVTFRMGLSVVEDKPYPVLQALKLETLDVPPPFLKILEQRAADVIKKEKYPLKVRWIQIGDGWIRISAELVE